MRRIANEKKKKIDTMHEKEQDDHIFLQSANLLPQPQAHNHGRRQAACDPSARRQVDVQTRNAGQCGRSSTDGTPGRCVLRWCGLAEDRRQDRKWDMTIASLRL
jgi:hypothetical protein